MSVVGPTWLAPASAQAHTTTRPAAFAPAGQHGHGHQCTKIKAIGVGQDLGEGMTTATISVHGVAVGTTGATFTITGVVDGVAWFTGPIVFTSDLGTLTAEVTR